MKHSRNEVGSDVVDTGSLAELFKARLFYRQTDTNQDIFSQDTISSECLAPRIFLHTLAGDWYSFARESGFHYHTFSNTKTKLPILTSDHSLKENVLSHLTAEGHYIGTFCCFSVVASD